MSEDIEEQSELLPSWKEELLKFKWHILLLCVISAIGWAYQIIVITDSASLLPYLIQFPIVVRQIIYITSVVMSAVGVLGIAILVLVAIRRRMKKILDLVFDDDNEKTD